MPPRIMKLLLALLVGVFVNAVEPASAVAKGPKVAPRDPQVILLRGLANVFSYGMDDLSKQLRAAGIDSKVYNHAQWPVIAQEIAEAYRASPKRTRPIILIGHSLGANAVLIMAKQLSESGIPVDLVVTFDPTRSGPVTGAVRRYLNLYQSNNGWGEPLDVPVNSKRVVNSDVRHRNDVKGSIGHTNIEKNQTLHQEVVDEIVKLVGVKSAKS
ncbi:thioesterase domain-containing protein [Kaistia dalseonensis]|uniref:Pimeloyl-ACP methyl ester carboxylesterase n=1 Tax=Kaistia dalseonensis TaxID=410840 RepID=A0ABU0H194_9HYPH|nr:thioesterase domain-containing protein [Kaistia dalseonensis]MCX5493507.1 thioesterase domain-containing protein [Kaistia dalseonensis]MDQ0436067.1 pimeloyl-ACP methyl ester carboxylesterase [Kaistia dalseonensis]